MRTLIYKRRVCTILLSIAYVRARALHSQQTKNQMHIFRQLNQITFPKNIEVRYETIHNGTRVLVVTLSLV
jgi:hypothetical protein